MAFVNATFPSAAATSPVTTASVDMSTGGPANLLLVAIQIVNASAQSGGSVTDSSGNTYVPLDDWKKVGSFQFRVWMAINPVVTTTMTATVTWAGPGNSAFVSFTGFSGRSLNPIGKVSMTAQSGSTSLAMSAFAPTVSGSDYIAYLDMANSRLITSTGGWTRSDGNILNCHFQRQDNVSATVQDTCTVGTTSGSSEDYMIELLPAGYVGGSVGINWDSR